MKTYIFTDDGYWSSNGCSCCDDIYMESFNSEDVMQGLGSAHCEEDCYIQAIITEKEKNGIMISSTYEEALYEMDMNTIQQVAKELGIEVVIENEA